MGSGTLGVSRPTGSSFEAVYVLHARALTRFATVLVGPADAADVVSEAVVGCLRAGHWLAVEDPGAYLHRAVLNAARQWARNNSRRRAREEAVWAATPPARAAVAPEPGSAVAGEAWQAVRG